MFGEKPMGPQGSEPKDSEDKLGLEKFKQELREDFSELREEIKKYGENLGKLEKFVKDSADNKKKNEDFLRFLQSEEVKNMSPEKIKQLIDNHFQELEKLD